MTATVYPFLTSPDGVNWTPRVGPTSTVGNAAKLVWDQVNNLFIAVAADGVANNYCIYTSPDGINWTQRLANNNFVWLVTNGSGYTIALELFSPSVWYSNDGVTWTNVATTGTGVPAGGYVQTALCWDGTQFLGLTGFSSIHTTSPDGIAWTQHGSIHFQVAAMASNGSLTVCVGNSPRWFGPGDVRAIETSTDGVTWTLQNSPFDNGEVTYITYGDRWMISGTLASSLGFPGIGSGTATSTDGVTWTLLATPEDSPNNSADGAGYSSGLGQWVLIGNQLIPPATHATPLISTSLDDGSTWTAQSTSGMNPSSSMYFPTWSPIANIWVIGGEMSFITPLLNPPALTLVAQNITTVEVDWATTAQILYGAAIPITTHIAHSDGSPTYVEFVTAPTPGTVMDSGHDLHGVVLYHAWNSSPGFADSTVVAAQFQPTTAIPTFTLVTSRNPTNSPTINLTVTMSFDPTVYPGLVIPPGTTIVLIGRYRFWTEDINAVPPVIPGVFVDDPLFNVTLPLSSGSNVGVAHYTTVHGNLRHTPIKPHPWLIPLYELMAPNSISLGDGVDPPYSYNQLEAVFAQDTGAFFVIATGPFRIWHVFAGSTGILPEYMFRGVITVGAGVQRRSAVPDKRHRAASGAITLAASDSGVPSAGGTVSLGPGAKRSSRS